ncbi:MAG TPA: Fe-S protein assembly co-chaperone HscB [Thioploca sp.]|nr:Fe-S protein assembly co-chaperone HscB [Thioploca sp.]
MENYFTIFGLPQSFDVDIHKLSAYYRDLQRVVHPDKFINAPERERRLAMQKAVQINEAFQTLKDPLKCGLYLLQLHGIDTDNDPQMEAEFLMMQMELYEQLHNIKQQSNPIDSINDFLQKLKHEQQQLIKLLSKQFTQKDYQFARDNIYKLQFFTKLNQEALKLEEELL